MGFIALDKVDNLLWLGRYSERVYTTIKEDAAEPELNDSLKLYLAYRQIPNYKIYLKDNNYYKQNYLDKDMSYIANLIDYISINYNYKFIYSLANSEEDKKHIKEMFEVLFDSLLEDIRNNNKQSHIYKNYIDDMNDEYKQNTTPERMVIDYKAGMTDDYFQDEYKEVTK